MSFLARRFSFRPLGQLTSSPHRNLFRLFSNNANFCEKSALLSRKRLPVTHVWVSFRCISSESLSNSSFFESTLKVLTQNQIVYALQQKLIDFHDSSGLPWWAVVMISTIAMRTFIIFPLAVHQQYVIAKLAHIRSEVDSKIKNKVSKNLFDATDRNECQSSTVKKQYYQELRKHQTELYLKHNCHPGKNFILVLVQVPVWMTLSGAIRNLCAMIPVRDSVAIQAYLELKATGFGILKDLTVADSSWVIPSLIVLTNLIIIQINATCTLRKKNWLRTLILHSMRCLSIVSFPVIIYVPKCLTLYWLTSSLCGLVQNLIFISPSARKILKIPLHDELRPEPFKHMKNKFKSKFYFFKY